MKKIFFLLGLLFFSTGSHADPTGYFTTGNDFFEWTADPNKSVYATVFTMAVVDAETNAYVSEKEITNNKLTRNYFCTPKNVVAKQITDLAKKYISNHPENRHLPAAVLIRVAIIPTWPCSDNPYK
ncbi:MULTISPECIES: Rap1a/Tai family immunity protein [unclassified Herbaspirillum]|uniref:Rap1a/Tai family immunity protein n=1 Tax=unclassified Herbaspirillum TaxID=2624150 RepID=UPI0010718698|nr:MULTISPECIES: Rap1a/Tai family immunity protein [unclassified Herbaspirillum]TFI11080.1 hypothetical protein E4P32_06165 [Herbaspirillum sp. 3R11]TFI16988.1 hypothetical protein E4P31_06165 [Herbaspirillum sp. 3R-11]TFI24159.1 hypothetical protein E4P30_16030 [Herbaspirillum sp. 3C11]